ELYYYLDATPTHSYLKMLYKYPHRAFPYTRLTEENRRRGKDQPELELLDTGVFEDDRYFDVFVEYAKASPDDILMSVTVHNRGPEAATIHVLPQIWFRNTWSWKPDLKKPRIEAAGGNTIAAEHPELGDFRLYCAGEPQLLFCDNETNSRRLYGQATAIGFFKDGFHEFVINRNKGAVNPQQVGTKAAAVYQLSVAPKASVSLRLRLVAQGAIRSPLPAPKPNGNGHPTNSSNSMFTDSDKVLEQGRREADEFYS